MIRKIQIIAILLGFLICGPLVGQTLESLRIKFERFEYQAVVDQARQMLQERQELDSTTVKEVLLFSAVSQYSLQRVDAAMVDFLQLLQLDPNFHLDPSTTSPKIIQFFDEIKQGVHRKPEKERVIVRIDTLLVPVDSSRPLASALKRSMLWPGWGHCYLGDKTCGRILRGAGLLTFTAAVFTTIDCREKEKAYLNTTQRLMMDQRYTKYNQAFKTRNYLWGSFAAIWVYSQLDILYFHHTSKKQISIGLQPQPSQWSLCCQIPF